MSPAHHRTPVGRRTPRVYRHPTDSALNECYFENEQCGRTYHAGGHLGSGDDADFIIKVFRRPGSPPTCTTYTVFMQNG